MSRQKPSVRIQAHHQFAIDRLVEEYGDDPRFEALFAAATEEPLSTPPGPCKLKLFREQMKISRLFKVASVLGRIGSSGPFQGGRETGPSLDLGQAQAQARTRAQGPGPS